jgi:hypothetical protein
MMLLKGFKAALGNVLKINISNIYYISLKRKIIIAIGCNSRETLP